MAGDSGIVFGSDTGDSVTGGFETSIEPDCMVAQATPIAVDNPAKLMMIIWLVFNDIIRRKKEEGRRKKEEGRRKKEEGRRKKEEGNAIKSIISAIENVLIIYLCCYFYTS